MEVSIKKYNDSTYATCKYDGSYEFKHRCFNYVLTMISGKNVNSPNVVFRNSYEFLDNVSVEVGVPTRNDANLNVEGIELKNFPEVDGLHVIYTGSYAELPKVYEEITKYAKENNIKIGLPAREIIHKGPGIIFKGNPKKYITEIMFPVTNEE